MWDRGRKKEREMCDGTKRWRHIVGHRHTQRGSCWDRHTGRKKTTWGEEMCSRTSVWKERPEITEMYTGMVIAQTQHGAEA